MPTNSIDTQKCITTLFLSSKTYFNPWNKTQSLGSKLTSTCFNPWDKYELKSKTHLWSKFSLGFPRVSEVGLPYRYFFLILYL